MVGQSYLHVGSMALIGRHPTKAMLLWLGSYTCFYVSAHLSTYLCIYFYVWSQGSDLVFTVFGLTPFATALSKRSTGAQMFSLINILNCLPPLLALCVLKHVSIRSIILTGGKNNNKIKITESGQLAVDSRHPPLRLQIIPFISSENPDRIDCLPVWGGRGCVKRWVLE